MNIVVLCLIEPVAVGSQQLHLLVLIEALWTVPVEYLGQLDRLLDHGGHSRHRVRGIFRQPILHQQLDLIAKFRPLYQVHKSITLIDYALEVGRVLDHLLLLAMMDALSTPRRFGCRP